MVAVCVAFTSSVFANPSNINANDKISIDVCGDGLVHAVIETTSLAAQSTHKNVVFSSRKIIISEIATAAINPILNTTGIVRAQTVTSLNGITYLGYDPTAVNNIQP
jgi:hypothetical protein